MILKKFKSIAIKLMHLNDRNSKLYRLYKDNKEFIDIQAGTVYEAIQKSEVKTPTVIKVIINRLEGIIKNYDKLSSDGSSHETKIDPGIIQDAQESTGESSPIDPTKINQEVLQAIEASKAASTAPNNEPAK